MKKIVLLVLIIFSGLLIQAQQIEHTDLDIANALIGQPINDLQKIADSLGVQMSYDGRGKLFVTANGTTNYYKVLVTTVYHKTSPGNRLAEDNCIAEVFVRYTLSSHFHLRNYQAYEIPENTDSVDYEKKLGKNKAHLKLIYK